ncbi:MAG: LysM peptidoglycan-binding domain-containing protein [Nitrosomonadales bacterium]|nr:LysM peptidoglycan-binding domain-containing protein [Nitrosomonadales bacterium]
MRKIISLICLLLPIAAYADELQLRENAPDRYIVVKGDTLWDISSKFFSDPWKWPQIWGYNKDTIKDPHWIYPGNVVYLDHVTRTLKIDESGAAPAEAAAAAAAPDSGVVPPIYESEPSSMAGAEKYSPRARVVNGRSDAIPMISLKDIGPFLARPLVIEDDELDAAPVLAGTYEQRQLLGTGDVAYAQYMPSDKGERWQIYREDHTFKDPDTGEVLGHEVAYLGDASVEKFDEITTLRITHSVLEIHKGDRFAQATTGFSSNYLPRAPSKEISAKVISIYGGVLQAGQNAIVTLNRGKRDGLENGHVLALYQTGEELPNGNIFKRNIVLPDVRYGLLFVFRVFDKVSYALVMETRLPVQLLDRASNPE